MPGGHYHVFKNLRPPVAIDDNGKSPIKTRQPINEENMKSLTDDGRFEKIDWNK